MDHSKQALKKMFLKQKFFAVVQPSVPQMTTVGNVLKVFQKIRDEFADIDDSESKMVRAEFNGIRRSFHQFDEYENDE
ncbi:unnamed protein product, partial [Mesorhabditis belari]|uniref:Uncharacterized protein n=1 Tax=Mesorhabditis belari TaxID=2138241 RepID=A0AAF3F1B3_9BILA